MKILILITLLITSLNILADTTNTDKEEFIDCTNFEMIEHCIDGFCYCSKEEN